MKILIIEDEKLLADSLKTMLEAKGFEVETAYDGETGAEYAELGIYDLLILDVMMPKLNGYQLAREVRAKRLTTPILMLTAKSGLMDRVEGLNAGADYYLTKPFDAPAGESGGRDDLREHHPGSGFLHPLAGRAGDPAVCQGVRRHAPSDECGGAESVEGGHLIPGLGPRVQCRGESCGGLCGLFAQKAARHRLECSHHGGAWAGISSGGG